VAGARSCVLQWFREKHQLTLDQLLQKAFSAARPQTWNYLPTDLSGLVTQPFRQSLKTFVFGQWDQRAVWSPFKLHLKIVLLTYLLTYLLTSTPSTMVLSLAAFAITSVFPQLPEDMAFELMMA